MVVHLSFLHAKQLLMKLLSDNLQTYANLLLGLMPGNYIPTRCLNQCRPVFIRVGVSIEERVDSHLDKTRPAAYLQRTTPKCEIENFFTTGRQKKFDCFSADGFCSHCNTVFEAMSCLFCPSQELRSSLTEEDIQRCSKKRELDALRRHYIQEKGFKVLEMWQ